MTASHALPRASELDLGPRVLYEGSVLVDYALRTGLATLLVGGGVRSATDAVTRRERRRLGFYAELAEEHDATRVFAPPPPVEVRAEAGRDLGLAGGHVEILRFDSPYAAINPEMRAAYARHTNNARARAQHWRHEDGPRQTLVVVHGFGASPAWFNTMFFSLREVFAGGWDVMLYTLPFHGSRRGRFAPVNGVELFAHGMAQTCEAMIHAIHDLRAFLDHLEATGVGRIGMTGLSLGGYTTALAAAVDPRLDFAVPNAPVTWLPSLLKGWFPANVALGALRAASGVGFDLVSRALAVHSPLTYRPLIPRDRLMVVAGLGDRLAPPEQSVMLWNHWDRPELHWFPGSHVLHFGRDAYRAELRRLMDEPRGEATRRGGRRAPTPRGRSPRSR